MDDLIIRSLQGRATPQEEARLSEWRRVDPQNERRWRTLQELWGVTGAAMPELSAEAAAVPDFQSLLDRSEAGRAGEAEMAIPIARRKAPQGVHAHLASKRPWIGRAARGLIAASLVAAGIGIGEIAHRRLQPTSLLANGEVITGAGEMTTVTLGDGSTVRLGPQSRLRLAETEDSREVWLDGRAFFAVQRDSLRPFVVRTDYGEALALGTRFEVQAEEEQLRVLVVEGEVAVESGNSVVQLSEGEASRSARGEAPVAEAAADVYAQLEWLGNAIVFQATPLSSAAQEIEERYGVDVVIEDSAMATLEITASFTGRPIEEILFVVCEIASAECVRGPSGEFRIAPSN
jgi:ferric-dicitrate binding protein FerR (iron transport regulator)